MYICIYICIYIYIYTGDVGPANRLHVEHRRDPGPPETGLPNDDS